MSYAAKKNAIWKSQYSRTRVVSLWKKKRVPRKLEPHEVIAKLKARKSGAPA